MRHKTTYKLFFILFPFMFFMNAFSQNRDSIMAINRKFKKEIGVDIQGLFKTTPGTTLILKLKNNWGRFIALTSAKNFRFQLGLSGTIPVNEKTNSVDTSNSHYLTKEARSFSVQPMFGMEKVNFYGKFNFYYGF